MGINWKGSEENSLVIKIILIGAIVTCVYQTVQLRSVHFTLSKVYFNKIYLKKKNYRAETDMLEDEVNFNLVNFENFISIIISW